MEEKVEMKVGNASDKNSVPEDIRGKFVEGMTHLEVERQVHKPCILGIILIIRLYICKT